MAVLGNSVRGFLGAFYAFLVERERVSRAYGRLVWGIDVRPLYASMEAIARAADGTTVLDVPCGGGVAFRALRPDQPVRYLAADLSEAMLARARHRARERGLDQIEFIRADLCRLPFEDRVADLCVSYSGLHCVARPDVAMGELVRCLRPGGELVGTTFLGVGSRRQDALLRAAQPGGAIGPLGTRDDVRGWLQAAGIPDATVEPDDGFAVFRGRKPPR